MEHGVVETRYAHDMLGRLTAVQNSHSAVRLHYDAMDNNAANVERSLRFQGQSVDAEMGLSYH